MKIWFKMPLIPCKRFIVAAILNVSLDRRFRRGDDLESYKIWLHLIILLQCSQFFPKKILSFDAFSLVDCHQRWNTGCFLASRKHAILFSRAILFKVYGKKLNLTWFCNMFEEFLFQNSIYCKILDKCAIKLQF